MIYIKRFITLVCLVSLAVSLVSCSKTQSNPETAESTLSGESTSYGSSSDKVNDNTSSGVSSDNATVTVSAANSSQTQTVAQTVTTTENSIKQVMLKLPEEYELEYTFTQTKNGKVVSKTTSKAIKTDKGVYFENGENKNLFIKQENGKYLSYNYDPASGKFKSMFSGKDGALVEGFVNKEELMMDEETVMSYGASITPYFNYYNSYANSIYYDSQRTIESVKCDVYKYDYNHNGEGFRYEFCIDPITGICFVCNQETFTQTDSSIWRMECTGYKTSSISLPAYE